MKSEIVIMLAIAFLLIGSLSAGVGMNEYYKENAPRTCEDFLGVGYIWLPQSVSSLFMNDNLILHFSMANGNNITVYGDVQDHGIYDLSCSQSSPPDAEVWMDDYTAISLATSTKPITTFVEGWRSGRIVLNAYNKETESKLGKADQLVASDDESVPPMIRALFEPFTK